MKNPVVLLVDDEVGFVETMAKRLNKRGLKVHAAFGGQEALDRLAQTTEQAIDVVVLDVKMPGMDGLEVLAAIKAKHPLVEVIMLTGHATVESAIEGMRAGAFDYLMKPAEMDVIMSKISDACDKKQRQDLKIEEAKAMRIALRRGD
jgi:DNA-binding NtrC family response regulator